MMTMTCAWGFGCGVVAPVNAPWMLLARRAIPPTVANSKAKGRNMFSPSLHLHRLMSHDWRGSTTFREAGALVLSRRTLGGRYRPGDGCPTPRGGAVTGSRPRYTVARTSFARRSLYTIRCSAASRVLIFDP